MDRTHHRHHGHQTHTIHVHYPQGDNNPPAILQRILGPENAAEVLQWTQGKLLIAVFSFYSQGKENVYNSKIFLESLKTV